MMEVTLTLGEVDPQPTLVTLLGTNGESVVVKEIYFGEHCIFCLRKADQRQPFIPEDGNGRKRSRKQNLKSAAVQELSEIENPSLLTTVNWMWEALQKRGNGGEDEIFRVGGEMKEVVKFSQVPKLCGECNDKVRGVDKLLREVKRAIDEMTRLISRWSGDEGGFGQFGEYLKASGLDGGKIKDTLDFVEEFRNRIVFEGEEETENFEDKIEPEDTESMVVDPLSLETGEESKTDTSQTGIPLSSSQLVYEDEGSSESELEEDSDTDPDYVKSEMESDSDDASSDPEDDLMDYEAHSATLPEKVEITSEFESLNFPSSSGMSTSNPGEAPTRRPNIISRTSRPPPQQRQQQIPDNSLPPILPRPPQLPSQLVAPITTTIIIPPGFTSLMHPNDQGNPSYVSVTNPLNQDKYFICLLDNCAKQFKGVGADLLLKRHQFQEHTVIKDDKPRQTCSRCGRTVLVSSFKTHQKRCTGLKQGDDIMQCSICGFEHKKRNFKTHMRTIHKIDLRGGPKKDPDLSSILQCCDLCKVKLPRKQLVEHMKQHVGQEYLLQCPGHGVHCSFVCVTVLRLRNHLQHIRQRCLPEKLGKLEQYYKKQLTCTECGFEANDSPTFRAHLLHTHENSEKNFPCPISGCEMKFSVRQSVVLHLDKHDFSKELDTQPCLQCDDKKEVKLEEMEAHLKEMHGAKEVYKCTQCPFRFSSREPLIHHMYDHRHGVLICDICKEEGGRFHKHFNLQQHYFTVHKIGKKFECVQCSPSPTYFTLHSYKQHVRKQHGSKTVSNPLKFKCQDCDQLFTKRGQLRDHRIKEHGAQPYVCNVCSTTFKSVENLKRHEKVVHRGIKITKSNKTYSCKEPNCGKVFKSNKQLKHHHSVVHLGETGKNYFCEHCAKPFTQSGLKRHVDTVHLGIKKYCCEVCGNVFANGTGLRRHKLIHTGERPFACGVCDQRFRQKEVLRRHTESHQKKGTDFKPMGPMKGIRKRVEMKRKTN